MVDELPARIQSVIELVGVYYRLPDKALIEKHDERLRVTDIKDNVHGDKHPHNGSRVYITRRALKHVVEERRTELMKNHPPAEVLGKISYAVEQITEVINNFDKYGYEYEPGKEQRQEKHFFAKHYPGEPSIRILCEKTGEGLEICSIHFKKQQKNE